MEVEVISTETIKPSSPTPDRLKTFKLSLLDQFATTAFSKLICFYLPSPTAAADNDQEAEILAKSQRLKTSLAEILPLFYPFAGRIKGNFAVDCNDDGATFAEARVLHSLAHVLKEPSDEIVRAFLPPDPQYTGSESGSPLLLIQASFFNCGGLTIGFLFSHKIADAATMATFITAWAAAARGYGADVHQPEFLIGASLFPPEDLLANVEIPSGSKERISTKRFVFAASRVGALKSKCVSERNQIQLPLPTRVESVSALIWKCATKATRSNSPNKKSASVLFQTVNLRNRFNPPLPGTSTGNIVGYFSVEEDGEIELHSAVDGLKKGLVEFCNGHVKKLQEREGGCAAVTEMIKVFQKGEADTYAVSSWCRLPVWEADFGWGKPVWISTAYLRFKNAVVLMDTGDGGGVEAWVGMEEEDMAAFEQDEELLAYASPNPPVSLS